MSNERPGISYVIRLEGDADLGSGSLERPVTWPTEHCEQGELMTTKWGFLHDPYYTDSHSLVWLFESIEDAERVKHAMDGLAALGIFRGATFSVEEIHHHSHDKRPFDPAAN